MKKYLFIAASALALASCSSEDFVGTEGGNVETGANKAINFVGNAGKITRATSNEGTPEKMLDYQFKVYGVKKASDGNLKSVFVNYSVWDAAANTTTSNTKGWEYVGTKEGATYGTSNISLDKDQTIKFWDYSASEYHFVAGSPISAFTYNVPVENKSKIINSATISGLAGHITANESGTALVTDPVYIADPKVVKKANYNEAVQFSFKRQQAMVRVGFYETIPGYFVSDVHFYAYNDAGNLEVTTGNNIILTSSTKDYFVGGKDVSGTVTYDWKAPSYTFKYTEDENLKKGKNWYAGKLATLPEISTAAVNSLYGSDKDMATTGYFTVLPTQAEIASPILIKCDYTLNAPESGETIKVTGATAAIPAAFSKWEANTRYTYLFKISDNTNGTTGDPSNSDDPAGLFPITFDAVVKDEKQGTITTIATPSITTYQANSVVENSGIKYVTNKEIKVTVTDNTNGDIKTLSEDDSSVGYVAVYKLSQARTEADLQINNIKTSELTSTNSKGVTLAADNKSFTFTPDKEGYYAIQYLTTAAKGNKPAAYTYKVVYVEAATK